MAKGYSIRYARNYTRRNGKWKLHSIAIWDDKGYTMTFPTIEKAKEYAREYMTERNAKFGPDESGYTPYSKIYLGKEYIETVDA